MNKTIITIVIAVFVILGGYLLLKGNYQPTPSVTTPVNQSPAAQSPQPQSEQLSKSNRQAPAEPSVPTENAIIYTNTGYSPTILKVKIGTTVTFKNQSSRSM